MEKTELKNQKLQRIKKGIVVSDKMNKTVVVAVSSLKKHPKYQKMFLVTKKYKAHDEKNEYKEGEKVAIVETSPMSKEKKWKVAYKF